MNSTASNVPLSYEDYCDTIDSLHKMKVPQIKDIARCLSLPLSGRKHEIIERVLNFFEQGKDLNDQNRLKAIRTLVLKVLNRESLPNYNALYDALQSGAFNFFDSIQIYQKSMDNSRKPNKAGIKKAESLESVAYRGHSLYFKDSPFYSLIQFIHGSPQIALPSKARAVCIYKFILNEEELSILNSNENVQLYILCGASKSNSPSTNSALLQFPIPLELHVNGVQLTENVKGIKGKPGTSRPANITKNIFPSPQLNKVEMVYAGSTETFLLYLYLAFKISSEELLQNTVSKNHIDIDSTIKQIQREYINESDDDEIIVNTTTISLKCPLTYSRINYPTKSIFCDHLQCFDGLSYLRLQEQVPTWSCPICSNKIEVTQLAICDYYNEILSSTPVNVESVILNKDGSWSAISAEQESDKYSQSEGSLTPNSLDENHNKSNKNVDSSHIEIISIGSETDEEDEFGNNNESSNHAPHVDPEININITDPSNLISHSDNNLPIRTTSREIVNDIRATQAPANPHNNEFPVISDSNFTDLNTYKYSALENVDNTNYSTATYNNQSELRDSGEMMASMADQGNNFANNCEQISTQTSSNIPIHNFEHNKSVGAAASTNAHKTLDIPLTDSNHFGIRMVVPRASETTAISGISERATDRVSDLSDTENFINSDNNFVTLPPISVNNHDREVPTIINNYQSGGFMNNVAHFSDPADLHESIRYRQPDQQRENIDQSPNSNFNINSMVINQILDADRESDSFNSTVPNDESQKKLACSEIQKGHGGQESYQQDSPDNTDSAIRYSSSAFDLALRSSRANGHLSGREIDVPDRTNLEQPSVERNKVQFTPLSNKIDRIRLESSEKKRSLSDSSNRGSWNKKMNT